MCLSQTWIAELRGPIHGRIQTLRGMCTDERSHTEIDAKLVELDELVYALSTAIESEDKSEHPHPGSLPKLPQSAFNMENDRGRRSHA